MSELKADLAAEGADLRNFAIIIWHLRYPERTKMKSKSMFEENDPYDNCLYSLLVCL
jgi:hypothetical protein